MRILGKSCDSYLRFFVEIKYVYLRQVVRTIPGVREVGTEVTQTTSIVDIWRREYQ